MVVLHLFGPLGFVIVFIWFFSPLGGQSSLWVLDIDTSIVSSQGQIRYINTKDSTSGVFSTGDVTCLSAEVQVVFQASLLASEQIKKGPTDAWNNVKIPMVDEMSPFVGETPGNPWITIDTADQDLEYVSLTGLITGGISTGLSYDFSIETAYMQLNCSPIVNVAANQVDDGRNFRNYFPVGCNITMLHSHSQPVYGVP